LYDMIRFASRLGFWSELVACVGLFGVAAWSAPVWGSSQIRVCAVWLGLVSGWIELQRLVIVAYLHSLIITALRSIIFAAKFAALFCNPYAVFGWGFSRARINGWMISQGRLILDESETGDLMNRTLKCDDWEFYQVLLLKMRAVVSS
jgi:hypothetical protein